MSNPNPIEVLETVAGHECVVYYAEAGTTPPLSGVDDVLESISNLSVTNSFTEIETTVRGKPGNPLKSKTYKPGLSDYGLSFTLLNRKGKSGTRAKDVAFVRDHIDAKKPVAFAVLDGPGGNGRVVEGYLFGGDESQGNDEANSWEMSFKPGETGVEIRKVVNGAIVTAAAPQNATIPQSDVSLDS